MHDLTTKEGLTKYMFGCMRADFCYSWEQLALALADFRDAQDAEIAALKAERDRLAEINRTLVKDFNTMMRANCRISEECDRLRPAVFEAHETFRSYAKLHESKGTPEGAEKAAANNRLGDRMFAALSPEPPAAISNPSETPNGSAASSPVTDEMVEVLRETIHDWYSVYISRGAAREALTAALGRKP